MLGNGCFDREEIDRARREAAIQRMAGYGGAIMAVHDAAGSNRDARLKTEGIGCVSDKTLGSISIAALRRRAGFRLLDQSGCNRPEPKDESRRRESKKNVR
ncbi:MAG: hypothetical protein LBG43_04990 [Treponema sp.]|jgi:hypothetical protein|nr:hypothetical protein [Treponema sp.]